MKRLFLALLLIASLGLVAFQTAEPVTYSWQDVFKTLILLVVAALGAPVTQLLKNLFKVEDRIALLITGVVAAVFAVLEMFLAGVLDFDALTLQNFPNAFFAVFSVATIYYALLKNSENFFGQGFLLKKPSG